MVFMSKTPRKSKASNDASASCIAKGGELHQVAPADSNWPTTNQGSPFADDQNSLKAGDRGPSLLEDFHLQEKINHFDHERIPERALPARGCGAHGVFRAYEGNEELTIADFRCDATNPSLLH